MKPALLPTLPYLEQQLVWPKEGRHILAHFDDDTIIVYQAYRPAIGRFAIDHGHFGGEFNYNRMSWIKPNFLWMMYRSNWGQSEGQDVVLGIRLRRSFFDFLLRGAVPSSWDRTRYATQDEWSEAVKRSDIRLQWDPDHLPTGQDCERRAIQLGLRGEVLAAYGQREIVEILDMTEFVAEQRVNSSRWREGVLHTPTERVYVPAD